MAEPNTLDGRLVILSAGDGETPEVFSPLCGIRQNGFNQTKQSRDEFIWDCADPLAPAWRTPVISGKQVDITGSGLYNLDNRATIQALYDLDTAFNARLSVYSADGSTVVGFYTGAWEMTSLNFSADRESLTTLELTLVSSGPIIWDEP